MDTLHLLAQTLHPLERKVLPLLSETEEFNILVQKSNLQEIEVMRALQWMENKGILKIEKREEEYLAIDKNGEKYLKEGLPEKKFLKVIKDKPLSLLEIQEIANFDSAELNACIGILRKQLFITIDETKKIHITENGIKSISKENFEELLLKKINHKKINPKDLLPEEKFALEQLHKRKEIIKIIQTRSARAILSTLGKKLAQIKIDMTVIDAITPTVLREKTWKGKNFRRYDVKINVPKIYGGRIHPLESAMKLVRNSFLNMGFKEMEGPWVESAFWCMDAMWIPQDHPAREVQDTFYLPYKGTIPDELSKKVAKVHENGGKSGSTGYGYKWKSEIAKQLLLRTHTTATTFRYFGEKNIKPPAKYFYIGRIFRNESIDATHLPEFHHSEGFVMEEGLTLRDLMGYIKEFYAGLGIHKIKFKPTYNPYTEPSMEAIGYNEQLGRWIELINSGIFRPESLEPYGITVPVIAWGLGVERLAMMIHEQKNIRDMLGATGDLDFLRNYKVKW